MMSVYNVNDLSQIPKSERYVFVFAEERDVTKLGTSPNISMQLGYYDDSIPVVVILTEPELMSIYEHILPPNTYLCLIDRNVLRKNKWSSWEYVFEYCITHEVKYALFSEWYSVLSKKEGDTLIPVNMNKNPCFQWEDASALIDFSSWYERMCTTLTNNKFCALGVERRHATDLLELSDKHFLDNIDDIPIQLVMYDFNRLKQKGCPKWLQTHTHNYFLRDTMIALLITALGGEVATITEFTVNAPSVVYTEEDLQTILSLPKKYPSLVRRTDARS